MCTSGSVAAPQHLRRSTPTVYPNKVEKKPRAKSRFVLVYEMAGTDPIPIATPSFTAV